MGKYFLVFVFTLWATVAAAQGTVVLLVDESSSLDRFELEIQYGSYERAMTGVAGLYAVDVVVVGFSSAPRIISMGSNLDAQAAFARLRNDVEYAENITDRGSTCLYEGLELVEALLPDLAHPVVLDISGDGEANCVNSDWIPQVLDRIAAQGVQVNTLYMPSDGGPIQGPDEVATLPFYQSLERNNGFTILADGMDDFELALFEKLTLELAYVID